MPETDERLDKVEQRLGSVETGLQEVRGEVGELRSDVGGLRTEVGELRTDVGELRTEVGGLHREVGGLRQQVNDLRVLGEKNTEDIRKIAEVQSHHGKQLEAIVVALEPLARIDAFVTAVSHEHEERITALEKHTGIPRATTAGQ